MEYFVKSKILDAEMLFDIVMCLDEKGGEINGKIKTLFIQKEFFDIFYSSQCRYAFQAQQNVPVFPRKFSE